MLSAEILNLKPAINMLRMMLAALNQAGSRLFTCNTSTSVEQSSEAAASDVLYFCTQVQ